MSKSNVYAAIIEEVFESKTGRFGRPLRPLDIRAAFWYGALGREMPLRWP